MACIDQAPNNCTNYYNYVNMWQEKHWKLFKICDICCCTAKERLKRNVGGNHWKMAVFLEESGNLKCIRYANARWLGNVADAIIIIIIIIIIVIIIIIITKHEWTIILSQVFIYL